MQNEIGICIPPSYIYIYIYDLELNGRLNYIKWILYMIIKLKVETNYVYSQWPKMPHMQNLVNKMNFDKFCQLNSFYKCFRKINMVTLGKNYKNYRNILYWSNYHTETTEISLLIKITKILIDLQGSGIAPFVILKTAKSHVFTQIYFVLF